MTPEKKMSEAKVSTEVFRPTSYYRPGATLEDQPTPQPAVALTSEQVTHLAQKGWIPADKFLAPLLASEHAAQIADEQAEEDRLRVAAEEEKQKQADDAARELKAKRDAEEAAAEAQRQDTPSFLIRVALAAKRPLEQRRSWIGHRHVWLSEQIGSFRGWRDQSDIYAREAIALKEELCTIRERIAAIDSQLQIDIEKSAKV